MSQFNKLKVGTKITNVSPSNYEENYRVEALGEDWAVVRNIETGYISSYVIEPEDSFEIGISVFNDSTGNYEIVKGEI